jgi:hypothetical protein
MKNVTVLLILMILLSLFVGIPLNGHWWVLYKSEFFDIPHSLRHPSMMRSAIYLVLILSHVGILALPFLIGKAVFKRLLVVAPLLFLISFYVLDGFFIFLLIPFILTWLAVAVLLSGKKLDGPQAPRTQGAGLELRTVVIIMIVLSFVSGLHVEGRWRFVFEFEWISYPRLALRNALTTSQVILWAAVIVLHLFIIMLPFYSLKPFFKTCLYLLPPLYILCFSLLMKETAFLLVPFGAAWIWASVKANVGQKSASVSL